MPDTLTFTSVHTIPDIHASAAFTSKTSEVFKEEHNIAPIIINDKMKYIPWGGDNQMPYNIIDIVNSIRLAKGNVFAEWKQSDTAKLFEDHGYKNKKQAGGYFF